MLFLYFARPPDGLNHNTDIKLAKKLIEEAYNCGADAVKFQIQPIK